mmetsp:Transcript_6744/g.16574  ORF Transcript_6744/g.16574 Transcript_6744/m.16574 type:complete len:99 (+) Transcript_6744:154-450(+)
MGDSNVISSAACHVAATLCCLHPLLGCFSRSELRMSSGVGEEWCHDLAVHTVCHSAALLQEHYYLSEHGANRSGTGQPLLGQPIDVVHTTNRRAPNLM